MTRHPLKYLARNLRNNATGVEAMLWGSLKHSRLDGVKFRRQQTMGNYIVDFVSFEKKIVIELDGSQHNEHVANDKVRDDCLRTHGFKVLRFYDNEVIENIEGVLEVIRQHCQRSAAR